MDEIIKSMLEYGNLTLKKVNGFIVATLILNYKCFEYFNNGKVVMLNISKVGSANNDICRTYGCGDKNAEKITNEFLGEIKENSLWQK